MNSVTVSKAIDAPIAAVWAPWADFGNVYTWHPIVKHSELVGDSVDQPIRVGSKRQCDLADGKNWVREEIVEFKPEARMKVDLYDGTMPVKSATAHIVFTKLSENRSRIDLRMDFETKFGLLGKIVAPMIRRQFKSMITQVLDASAQEALKAARNKPAEAVTPATISAPNNASLAAS